MSIVRYLQRIERIDQLIRLQATGTPKELANRLSLSESVIYQTLAFMKKYGAPIYYNKYLESYCYEEPCFFVFTFKKKKIE
ncbi:MAG: HTH domain-containing protein [Bacteroidota bacterium]|nr:HTH domain-containing protein [Bacteroidota bacterium]